jgi:hypothetical protein
MLYIPRLRTYWEVFRSRILPTFDAIGREADVVARAELQRLWSVEGNEDTDEGALAERAQDSGIEHVETLMAMRQTVLNLFTAGLYHWHEQMLTNLYSELNRMPLGKEVKAEKILAWVKEEFGVDTLKFASDARLTELRHIANAVKHAEGPSSTELRGLRPDLFVHPAVREYDAVTLDPEPEPRQIRRPLSGEGIYLSAADFDLYHSAAIAWWTALAVAFESDPI